MKSHGGFGAYIGLEANSKPKARAHGHALPGRAAL